MCPFGLSTVRSLVSGPAAQASPVLLTGQCLLCTQGILFLGQELPTPVAALFQKGWCWWGSGWSQTWLARKG